MSTITTQDAIKAATSVARDIADGGLSPSDLERQAVAECRELFGSVAGPDDPMWELHRDIARQVLALDGVPADELAEWLAVARQRAGEAIGSIAPAETPLEPVSVVGEAHGPGTVPSHETDDAPAADDVPGPAPVALAVVQPPPTSPRPDRYDPMAAWAAGSTRRY